MAAWETHSLVYWQLQDVFLTQQQKIRSFGQMIKQREEESVSREEFDVVVKELENERLEHAKTKALLFKESEKLQFALGEVEILLKQLDREKKAFENALESIKNKALKESTKNDKLISKCNEIENQMEKQDDILTTKEVQIKELCHLLAEQKEALKQQVTDFEIQKQQDAYIAHVLKGKKRKTFGKFPHVPK
ncbi:spermatogenesis-associated protein 24-like isoform X1 [Carcharodon carcharias]|uniref:spermatogenesis-associated protein 24-like isoform X1 n=1 Tax=Carcharodon carcharias TaxID=13397 RepID=UPI001B7EB124|nr:spermatogenesis-associated protein 24-like isoform X1 [Carcharodon carcharias]